MKFVDDDDDDDDTAAFILEMVLSHWAYHDISRQTTAIILHLCYLFLTAMSELMLVPNAKQ